MSTAGRSTARAGATCQAVCKGNLIPSLKAALPQRGIGKYDKFNSER
jgi:hypothetical protein